MINPDNYIYVAEKIVEAVLQMEQLVDRLLSAQEESRYWLEQKKHDIDPF
jgi:hypothetical protein